MISLKLWLILVIKKLVPLTLSDRQLEAQPNAVIIGAVRVTGVPVYIHNMNMATCLANACT